VFYTLPDAARGNGLSLISAQAPTSNPHVPHVEHAFRTPLQRLDLPAKLVLANPPDADPPPGLPTIATAVPAIEDVLAYQLIYTGRRWLERGATPAQWRQSSASGAELHERAPGLPALAAYGCRPRSWYGRSPRSRARTRGFPVIDTPRPELRRTTGDTFRNLAAGRRL